MPDKEIAAGVVHRVPPDLQESLTDDADALTLWEDITALARNEWICWIENAKKPETRSRRIERVVPNSKRENAGLAAGPGVRIAPVKGL